MPEGKWGAEGSTGCTAKGLEEFVGPEAYIEVVLHRYFAEESKDGGRGGS